VSVKGEFFLPLLKIFKGKRKRSPHPPPPKRRDSFKKFRFSEKIFSLVESQEYHIVITSKYKVKVGIGKSEFYSYFYKC